MCSVRIRASKLSQRSVPLSYSALPTCSADLLRRPAPPSDHATVPRRALPWPIKMLLPGRPRATFPGWQNATPRRKFVATYPPAAAFCCNSPPPSVAATLKDLAGPVAGVARARWPRLQRRSTGRPGLVCCRLRPRCRGRVNLGRPACRRTGCTAVCRARGGRGKALPFARDPLPFRSLRQCQSLPTLQHKRDDQPCLLHLRAVSLVGLHLAAAAARACDHGTKEMVNPV